jgi:hypothetical protein
LPFKISVSLAAGQVLNCGAGDLNLSSVECTEPLVFVSSDTGGVDDEWYMETFYNPSFNAILRSLRSLDLIRDRDFLKQSRKYLMDRRDMAKSHLESVSLIFY